jgi:hypothetical protein
VQGSLFDHVPAVEIDLGEGCYLTLRHDIRAAEKAAALFETLLETLAFKQSMIRIAGRKVPTPRLNAWYGDASYAYTGVQFNPLPWTPELQYRRTLHETPLEDIDEIMQINVWANKTLNDWLIQRELPCRQSLPYQLTRQGLGVTGKYKGGAESG